VILCLVFIGHERFTPLSSGYKGEGDFCLHAGGWKPVIHVRMGLQLRYKKSLIKKKILFNENLQVRKTILDSRIIIFVCIFKIK